MLARGEAKDFLLDSFILLGSVDVDLMGGANFGEARGSGGGRVARVRHGLFVILSMTDFEIFFAYVELLKVW